jgi:hypothetical protein
MDEVEAKREPELLAGKMRLRTRPRRTEAVFAGIGLDEVESSLTVFAGTDGLTVSTVVEATASVTGSKSLMGSYGTTANSVGLTTWELNANKIV